MPKELLEVGLNDPSSIMQQAFALTTGVEPEVADNGDDSQEDVEPQDEDLGNTEDSESTDEDVDNDEDEGDEQSEDNDEEEFEDEDLEEGESDEEEEGDDEPEETTEEPEEDSYESGYLYKPKGEDVEIFLRAIDPVTGEGSTYLNRQEAEVGLGRMAAHVGDLKKQLSEGQTTANARLSAVEKELTTFRSVTTPEAARDILIKSKLPEKFRNVDPTTLEDNDLKSYKQSVIDAEIAASREISEEADRVEAARNASTEAENRATAHVSSRAADVKFFGFRNTEDRVEVQKKLRDKPEGSEHTYQDIAISIGKAFGNGIADMFLKTLIDPSPAKKADEPESKDSAPKKKVTKKAPATKQTAKKVARKVKRKKKPSGAKSTSITPMPATARDMLSAGFEIQQSRNRKRR